MLRSEFICTQMRSIVSSASSTIAPATTDIRITIINNTELHKKMLSSENTHHIWWRKIKSLLRFELEVLT